MITIIEQRTMDAIQSINRKMKDSREIDWEQRRYEIAKAAMQGILANIGMTQPINHIVDRAVKYADALIAELKKPSNA